MRSAAARTAATPAAHPCRRQPVPKSLLWVVAIAAPLLLSNTAPALREMALLNGRDFTGWTFYLEEKGFNAGGKGKISDFASVLPGGVIELRPQMHGALMTRRDYLNFRLHAEWRFPDPKGRNNTGLFIRIRPPFVWDTVHGESARNYMVQIM